MFDSIAWVPSMIEKHELGKCEKLGQNFLKFNNTWHNWL